MRRRAMALLLCLAVAAAGCGSILRETPIDVVGAGFQGISVCEDGKEIAKSRGSPVKPQLDPSRDHDLEIRVEGFEPARLRLESHVSGGRVTLLVVECLILPVIGLPILLPLSIASDYCEVLEPESPRVELRPSQAARPTDQKDMPIPSPTPMPKPSPVVVEPPAPTPAPQPTPSTTDPGSKRPGFCGACGARFPGEERFCKSCGEKR